MSKIENIEIFFLEYPFPKNLNYRYSGGLVENMIVGLIKITDSEGQYGLGVKFDEEILKKYPDKEKVNTMISTQEADIQLK